MEGSVGDIADSEMRGVDGWEISAQGLKEDQFKAVVMRLDIDDGTQVPGIVPPLGQIAVRRLILGKTDWW